MSKGTQTRERILERAAQLFSRQGYFGSSLNDIMLETGLEKGGIYNHFDSKEQLALEAFDYAYGLVQQRVQTALQDKKHAIDRLIALVEVFKSMVEEPVVIGGCPVLNTAIEADDAQPALRARAVNAMDIWRDTFHRIIAKGIVKQEIRADVDADVVASLCISMLEGAIMLSKLYDDTMHMQRATEHLTRYIETELRLD